jgi:hypothetical protein
MAAGAGGRLAGAGRARGAAGGGVGVLRARRRAPAVFFLGAFALAAMLPTSNLVRLISSIMAERFLYLPLVGIAGLVAVLADRWAVTPRRRTLATVAVGCVCFAAGVRTAVRNLDWRDEPTLWAATVEAAPDSAKAHKGYAEATFRRDADPATLALVVARAEHAVSLRPDYQQALVDLAGYAISLGDALSVKDGRRPAAGTRRRSPRSKARPLDERTAARLSRRCARAGTPTTPSRDRRRILYNNLALACVKLGELDRGPTPTSGCAGSRRCAARSTATSRRSTPRSAASTRRRWRSSRPSPSTARIPTRSSGSPSSTGRSRRVRPPSSARDRRARYRSTPPTRPCASITRAREARRHRRARAALETAAGA